MKREAFYILKSLDVGDSSSENPECLTVTSCRTPCGSAQTTFSLDCLLYASSVSSSFIPPSLLCLNQCIFAEVVYMLHQNDRVWVTVQIVAVNM